VSTLAAPLRELSVREERILRYPQLTPSQLRVLQMAADGETCESTAREIGMCVQTVKNHRSDAIMKLGADSMTHAVAQALRRGLIR